MILEIRKTDRQTQIDGHVYVQTSPADLRPIRERAGFRLYALLLIVSVWLWFIAIRAPLWLDETVSFAIISDGFSQILVRQGVPAVPAYPIILWFWTKIAGTSELALRIPSILAMLGATYLLYRAARELFDRNIAVIVALVFCLHPLVIVESIDARPYGFVMLATTTAIFALVRLRHSDSSRMAALFGFAAAGIVWFHFLSIVILPAFAICFLLSKRGNARLLIRQGGIALTTFFVAFLAVAPGLLYIFHSRGSHAFDKAPTPFDLAWSVIPPALLLPFVFLLFGGVLADAARRSGQKSMSDSWRSLLCLLVAFVPLLTLYFVSTKTSLTIFAPRYRLIAVPGIALCWGLLLNEFSMRWLRLVFCVTAVSLTTYKYMSSPESRSHRGTWKYALEFAGKNASSDNAPLVMCSDLPEADHMPMPTGPAIKDSTLFSNITYYKLSVPVVPLPRALNDQAIQLGSAFVREATQKKERFLALGFIPSYKTLDWLEQQTSGTFDVHDLGTFDGVKVLEFVPVVRKEAPSHVSRADSPIPNSDAILTRASK